MLFSKPIRVHWKKLNHCCKHRASPAIFSTHMLNILVPKTLKWMSIRFTVNKSDTFLHSYTFFFKPVRMLCVSLLSKTLCAFYSEHTQCPLLHGLFITSHFCPFCSPKKMRLNKQGSDEREKDEARMDGRGWKDRSWRAESIGSLGLIYSGSVS